MLVAELMTQDPATTRPDATADEAWRQLQTLEIRHLPVLKERHLVGIVSDRDVRTVLTSPAGSLEGGEVRYGLDHLGDFRKRTYLFRRLTPG